MTAFALPHTRSSRSPIWAALLSPAVLLMISANIVNVGNLAFNILFSRWAGPEIFADIAFLLTIKLSILSGLGAIQYVVAQRSATLSGFGIDKAQSEVALASRHGILAGLMFMPVFGMLPLLFGSGLSGSGSEGMFVVFALALPFMVPLSLARGLAQGTISTKRLVMTAQTEMLVRLGGSALMWQLGFGVKGIAFALVAAVFMAWLTVRPEARIRVADSRLTLLAWRGLIYAALPWAMLQLSQIVILDGDIVIARKTMTAQDSGLIAAADLVQRIIFFASFALSGILLPLAERRRQHGSASVSLLPIFLLFAATSLPAMLIMAFAAKSVALVLFGTQFADAATALLPASIAATTFTASYLIATILMVQKPWHISAAILLAASLQFGILLLAPHFMTTFNVASLFWIKAMIQSGVVLTLLGTMLLRARKSTNVASP